MNALSTDPSLQSLHLFRLRCLLCIVPLACFRFHGLLWRVRVLHVLLFIAKSDELPPKRFTAPPSRDSQLFAHVSDDFVVALSDASHCVVMARDCRNTANEVNLEIEAFPAPPAVRG